MYLQLYITDFSSQDTLATYHKVHSPYISVHTLCGLSVVHSGLSGRHLSQWYLGQHTRPCQHHCGRCGPLPQQPLLVYGHHDHHRSIHQVTLNGNFGCHTHTGYGDLSATNVREMIYSIAVMVAGKLIFGFILGSIASTLANLDAQRVLFEEKLNALKVSKN